MIFFKLLFWNCTILGALVFFFEIFFGTWIKGQVEPPGAIPLSGVKFDRTLLDSSFGISERVPDINFTTTYTPNINKEKQCRIILLGGSTTEERVLTRDEAWSGRLYKDLNSNSSLRKKCLGGIEIVNAGVSGHSISSNIYDIKVWLKRSIKKADIVILYQGINDNYNGLMDTKSLRRKMIIKNLFKDPYYYISYNSAVYKGIKNLKKGYSLINNKESIRKEPYTMPPYKQSKVKFHSIEINNDELNYIKSHPSSINYRMNIKDFHNTVTRQLGAKLILITQNYPFCNLKNKNRIDYITNIIETNENSHALPIHPRINETDFSILDLNKKDYTTYSIGYCSRIKNNRDNFIYYYDSLDKQKQNGLKLIDYAKHNTISLKLMTWDAFHKDPKTSKLLYDDLKELGLIDSIEELLYLN